MLMGCTPLKKDSFPIGNLVQQQAPTGYNCPPSQLILCGEEGADGGGVAAGIGRKERKVGRKAKKLGRRNKVGKREQKLGRR